MATLSEDQKETIVLLRQQGWTVRRIGNALRKGRGTVHRVLKEHPVPVNVGHGEARDGGPEGSSVGQDEESQVGQDDLEILEDRYPEEAVRVRRMREQMSETAALVALSEVVLNGGPREKRLARKSLKDVKAFLRQESDEEEWAACLRQQEGVA